MPEVWSEHVPKRVAEAMRLALPTRARVATVFVAAAASVLAGLTAACASQDASVADAGEAKAADQALASAVPPATPTAGPSSPGSAVPLEATIEVAPPPVPAPPEDGVPLVVLDGPTPEVASPPAPVPPAAPAGAGGSAVSDRGEPRPQPQILHVDVDGDEATIISGSQAPTPQRGEEGPRVLAQSKGEKFIWHDGAREVPVWQDTRLVVSDVVPGRGWGDPSGPVFWSESNSLMALPGGVVLMLDPTWDTAAVDSFMRSNRIASSEIEGFEGLVNSFKVATDPGFPSLWTANSLAGHNGVIVSSPNWWIDQDAG